MKVSIIQSIDRKIALDDLALTKGLDFGELLDEIEAIVYSGTKINIDYFLNEIMSVVLLLNTIWLKVFLSKCRRMLRIWKS